MVSQSQGILPIAKSTFDQNIEKQGMHTQKQGMHFGVKKGGFNARDGRASQVSGCAGWEPQIEDHSYQKQNLSDQQSKLQEAFQVGISASSKVVAKSGWEKSDFRRVLIYNGWKRVGHGEPYHDCGKTLVFGCLNVEAHKQSRLDEVEVVDRVYVKLKRRTCLRASCPVCFEKWAGKEAHKIEYRLSQWKGSGQVIHVMVSVPPSLWYKDLGELRTEAQRIAKKVGVFGGSCIIHAERQKCVFCGEPKDTQTERCLNCGCSSFSWEFSPHFHLLGYGWIHGHKVKDVYEREGWVIKNLGVRKSVGGTAQYQLSHCSEKRGRQSVTWFGRLSYNKLRVAPEPESEKEVCPLCQAELVPLFWVGEGEMPFQDEGEYFDNRENWIKGFSFHGSG
jgi:hypothetical protein